MGEVVGEREKGEGGGGERGGGGGGKRERERERESESETMEREDGKVNMENNGCSNPLFAHRAKINNIASLLYTKC